GIFETWYHTITGVDPPTPSTASPANTTVARTVHAALPTQGSATGSDTCGAVAISHTDAFAPGCGNTGVITRTWKATDDSGNFATCDQTITVVDTTKPSITSQERRVGKDTSYTMPATQGSATGSDTSGNVASS